MKVRSLHIQGYRSVRSTALRECGPLNVLIGRNNAGKSNVLSAFDLMFEHLKRATVAGQWPVERPLDHLNRRTPETVAQIGIEFELPLELNRELAERVAKEAQHLEKTVEQFGNFNTICFILGCVAAPKPFTWIQNIGLGLLQFAEPQGISLEGLQLLHVSKQVGTELFAMEESASSLRNDVIAFEAMKGRSDLEYIFRDRQNNLPKQFILEQLLGRSRSRISAHALQALERLLIASTEKVDFEAGIDQFIAEAQEAIRAAEQRQTEGTIVTFAGSAKVPPPYAMWLMKAFGETTLLHLRETKQPIARTDAQALLSLKITRGGPARLALLQETIRSLLGVSIDAFSSDARGGTQASRKWTLMTSW